MQTTIGMPSHDGRQGALLPPVDSSTLSFFTGLLMLSGGLAKLLLGHYREKQKARETALLEKRAQQRELKAKLMAERRRARRRRLRRIEASQAETGRAIARLEAQLSVVLSTRNPTPGGE
jgi:hypothetical protein